MFRTKVDIGAMLKRNQVSLNASMARHGGLNYGTEPAPPFMPPQIGLFMYVLCACVVAGSSNTSISSSDLFQNINTLVSTFPLMILRGVSIVGTHVM